MNDTQGKNILLPSYDLAAFDLDGTILDHGKLSNRTINTLKALHESGIHVVFATGRHHKMILGVRQALPFVRYAITSSGSQVMDLQREEMISFASFDYETRVGLMDKICADARASNIFLEDYVLIPLSNIFKFRRQLNRKMIKQEISEFFDWAKFVIAPKLWVRNTKNTVFKLNAFFAKPERCMAFIEEAKALFDIEAVSTLGIDIEMNPKGIHKGYGLSHLCEHLGIDIKKTIIFGDSANDIEIMKTGGYAVAMENASDDVKAVADRIAPHVEVDGVAQVLEEVFGLTI